MSVSFVVRNVVRLLDRWTQFAWHRPTQKQAENAYDKRENGELRGKLI